MSELPLSPLAPDTFPPIPPIGGVSLATFAAGLRYQNRADLMLVALPQTTTVAGTLTKSLCSSAPVDWCREILGAGRARALVVNSGNANAFTGKLGDSAAELTAVTIAEELGIEPHTVFLASTGVIAETLPVGALTDGVRQLAGELGESSPERWLAAANAIRTTDTFAKGSFAVADIGEAEVVVGGLAKGSGMIAPDMATMLCFVFTDAAISTPVLQEILSSSVDKSYHRITVDSDTSTSDTVLLFATGLAGNPIIDDPSDPALASFRAAVDTVNLDLAHQVVRDGEGATKFIEVTVIGAESDRAAKVIGFSIANSPLVKTAIGAADANWGRIVMAVGKAGERADRDSLAIWIGDEQCAEEGMARPQYCEEAATEHLRGDDVILTVDVGIGDGKATVWTCDLTHGYIDINAGYRS